MRKSMGKAALACTLALSMGVTGGMVPNQMASAKKAKKTVKVTKIKVSTTKVTLTEGKTKTIKVTVIPSKAKNKKVTFTTSNKKVAKVSSKGKITAVKAGTAKITVKAKDGSGKKAFVNVTVKKATPKMTIVQGKDDGTMTTYKFSAKKSYKVVTIDKNGNKTEQDISSEDLQQTKKSLEAAKSALTMMGTTEKAVNLDEIYFMYHQYAYSKTMTVKECIQAAQGVEKVDIASLNNAIKSLKLKDTDKVTISKEKNVDDTTLSCGMYAMTFSMTPVTDKVSSYAFSAALKVGGATLMNYSATMTQKANDVIALDSISYDVPKEDGTTQHQEQAVNNVFVKALVSFAGDTTTAEIYYGKTEDSVATVGVASVKGDTVTVSIADTLLKASSQSGDKVTIYEK